MIKVCDNPSLGLSVTLDVLLRPALPLLPFHAFASLRGLRYEPRTFGTYFPLFYTLELVSLVVPNY